MLKLHRPEMPIQNAITAHELAKRLLESPDYPVVISDKDNQEWGITAIIDMKAVHTIIYENNRTPIQPIIILFPG